MGPPAGALGAIGDNYLDDVNGDTYLKTGAVTWTLSGNIMGPSGPPGPSGGIDYGDGSDGDVDLDGVLTFAFAPMLTPGVYTVIRNVFAKNLTVRAGITLKPAGWKIYANNTLTNLGLITAAGGETAVDATLAVAGIAGIGGGTSPNLSVFGKGYAGAAGGTGAVGAGGAGSPGTTPPGVAWNGKSGGAGGKGGNGTPGAGGFGGSVPVVGAQYTQAERTLVPSFIASVNTTSFSQLNGGGSGSGGGAGGGDGVRAGGHGGGSGGSGGILYIACSVLDNSAGSILATGGRGGHGAIPALSPAGNCGGGAGGGGAGGGILYLVYSSTLGLGIYSCAGGAKGLGALGTGTGTQGADGAAGADGIMLRNAAGVWFNT